MEVMKQKQWLQGEETRLFEEEISACLGVRRAIFVNSGSSALLVSAHALAERGVGEVICPSMGFPTLYSSLISAGFKPVIVDVDDTLTIDPGRVVDAITPQTKGIAVVHMAGNIGYLDELKRITDAYGLWLLEDNCDGFGGTYHGRKVGSIGTISVTSFHVAHIISSGQGGGVFTNDEGLADAAVSYRDWGRLVHFSDDAPGIPPLPDDHMQRYTYSRLGFNLSALELQAVLGRRQLKRIDEYVAARSRNYNAIRNTARGVGLFVPQINGNPAWFAAPLSCGGVMERSEVFRRLREAEIEYRNILSGNITLHPAFRGRLEIRGPLSVADYWGKHGFWVSCHSSLTEAEVQYLCDFFCSL